MGGYWVLSSISQSQNNFEIHRAMVRLEFSDNSITKRENMSDIEKTNSHFPHVIAETGFNFSFYKVNLEVNNPGFHGMSTTTLCTLAIH